MKINRDDKVYVSYGDRRNWIVNSINEKPYKSKQYSLFIDFDFKLDDKDNKDLFKNRFDKVFKNISKD